MEPHDDAQADVGVLDKGCSSSLDNFQGAAALCLCTSMGQEHRCAPAAIVDIRQPYGLNQQQLNSSHLAEKAAPS